MWVFHTLQYAIDYRFVNFKGSFYAVFKYVCFYPVSNAQALITV
nr:MAG TPA: hypothetical protein [Caudoviricetes sp.]